ncbi:MAG: hypothetical protein HKP61_01000 [Dactylosporangium sp.]|nr:hypothetical protein [Dactylosporangium sp.]NNJ59548.1 hypothetical protein [Dactylosporangium sp.]
MTDPITASIAAVLATGVTTALTDGGRALITRAAALVRERLHRNPSDEAALDTAVRRPNDPAAIEALARLLDQRMRDDPRFADQLKALWEGATPDIPVRHDEVSNTISGTVYGSAIQARDVHGGITLNAPARS